MTGLMVPVPLDPVPEVYVLWHPKCPVGEIAARRIYSWLRPGFGLGPRVFYRSLAAPGAPPQGLPLPLPGERRRSAASPPSRSRANLQIVLPLIDDHMIADGVWRYWLESLGRTPAAGIAREILPIALDATAFGAPAPIRELNFIRPKSPGPLATLDEAEREVLLRSLIRQLTEALCRLLLGTMSSASTEGRALKLKVFLSHAKADGTGPARRIRDYIYGQTQLAAFYDENDIPFGSAFAKVLAKEAQARTTVALIAVRSARYATRPWCRREISLFRRPRQIEAVAGGARYFRLNPVLVVGALEPGVPTVGVPELGNAPEIYWSSEMQAQEEQVVTTLLRDALLSELHLASAKAVPAGHGSIVLNWLPDPTTLLGIEPVRTGQELVVHYPGQLSGLDLDMLGELFPHLQMKSFEEQFQ